MAENTGGTSDPTQDVSFTQEQMDTAMAEAKKAASDEVWSKFQGDKDREVAEYRKIAEGAVNSLTAITAKDEASKVDAMTPEEKAAYYAQKMYEQGLNPSASPTGTGLPSPASGVTKPPAAPPPSGQPLTAGEAQAILKQQAVEAGLDPDGIDFTSVAGFIKSVAGKAAKEEKTPEERNAELEREKAANHSPSASGSGKEPITKMNPVDLIRQGAGDKSPWQRQREKFE